MKFIQKTPFRILIGFTIFACCGLYMLVFAIMHSGTALEAQPGTWHKKLLLHLNTKHPLYSPNSRFFSPPTHESLGLFLESCNMSLARDACSMLDFQPCRKNEVCHRKTCLWGKLDSVAGLGHQMTELMFFARLAHIFMLPHVFETFSSTNSTHSSSYDWAVRFFGLETTFRSLGSNFVKSESTVIDETLKSCDTFLRLNSQQCDDSMILSTEEMSKSSGNCFKSPLMHMIFANFAPCFRQSSLCHGSWVAQARSVPYDPSVVSIAWHIRVGDKTLYTSSSRYFRQVHNHASLVARHTPLQ
jgi:hypothetical protein